MHLVATVVAVTWVAFWVFWLTSAAGVKAGRTRWGRSAGVRVTTVLVVVLLVRAKVFDGATVTDDAVSEGVGLVLFLAGLAVAIWARRCLGRNWGAPMTEKVDPELVTSGPYRRVRHPIYSGLILAFVGTAVAVSWYWLVAVGLLGGYFVYSAVQEERYMAERFPETYPPYQRSTKMLVPFLL
jgi:protein-S-isoprenylcysteine O-methyltransferase Ste14